MKNKTNTLITLAGLAQVALLNCMETNTFNLDQNKTAFTTFQPKSNTLQRNQREALRIVKNVLILNSDNCQKRSESTLDNLATIAIEQEEDAALLLSLKYTTQKKNKQKNNYTVQKKINKQTKRKKIINKKPHRKTDDITGLEAVYTFCTFGGCKKFFQHLDALREHWDVEHPTIKKRQLVAFQCTKCKKTRSKRTQMINHVKKDLCKV